MAWIESHQELREHPKTYKLMDLLEIDKPQALGHLHLFWWWCVDYAPTGCLEGYTDLQLARAGVWTREPKMFVNALVESGFLERQGGVLTVHDWLDFCGELILKRLDRASGKRQKLSAERQKLSAYRTLPYRTQPNHIKPSALPSREKPLTEVQKVVLVFKMVSGYDKDDKAWDKLNFARCSKTAKNLVDFFGDWKRAADCVQDVYEKLNAKGLTVTIETIQKHAADWNKDKAEKEAKWNTG